MLKTPPVRSTTVRIDARNAPALYKLQEKLRIPGFGTLVNQILREALIREGIPLADPPRQGRPKKPVDAGGSSLTQAEATQQESAISPEART